LEKRDDSKLLIYDGKNISETVFSCLHSVLPKNSLLVFNNSKVISARLIFKKPTGAQIEIFCLEPFSPANFEETFEQRNNAEWICMVGNIKKWKEGKISLTVNINNSLTTVYAEIVKHLELENDVIIRFLWNSQNITFADIIDSAGRMPIPPYLKRDAVEMDKERYQTIFSKYRGSVAAPTAGLHFSENVMQKLHDEGIKKVELTLHVGVGTFKPVKSDLITEHKMHAEHFSISLEVLKQIRDHSGQVIAVGTTSLRTLESLYISGIKIKNNEDCKKINQWDGFKYESNLTVNESIDYIIRFMEENNLEQFTAETSLIIVPGFKIKVINGLITNFHQPRSTLLLLVAAFVGNEWGKIYQYALNNNFRFLSYGDCCFLKIKNYELRITN